ncbi:MAG: molybdate ABC transporter permease subunit [Merismopedia sp. SIO2A8]|nr:molybdate ABC transporter permease subunit [Merismopedia sp. SIO2A8]
MDFDLSPLWISLKTAIAATGFAFIGGIVAARAMLMYRGRWQGVLDGLLTMPLILPPTVVGFVLLLALGRSSPLGQLLEHMGITLIFSWTATVIASTVVAFPLMYKTVLGAFRQVDSDVLDCSRTLGASENRVFWQLLLPLAWPGVLAGTILAFARALGEFGATLMLAGSIPGRTKTMPIAIFFAGEAGHLGEALFWTVVLGSIALSAIVLINCFSENALTENTLAESWWAKAIATRLQQWFTVLGRDRAETEEAGDAEGIGDAGGIGGTGGIGKSNVLSSDGSGLRVKGTAVDGATEDAMAIAAAMAVATQFTSMVHETDIVSWGSQMPYSTARLEPNHLWRSDGGDSRARGLYIAWTLIN